MGEARRKRLLGAESVIPRQFCPACLTELNRATHPVYRVAPKPGDLNVCIECAAVTMYGDDLNLRALDEAERQALEAVDPKAWADVVRFQRIIREMPRQSRDTKTRQ
jgi:hypothetical protein